MIPTRCSSCYLERVLDTIEDAGVDVQPFLDHAGVTRNTLCDNEQQIPHSTFKNTLLKILDEVDLPALGLLEGDRWATVELGIVGYALFSSADLQAAINRYVRYQDLCAPIIAFRFLVEGERAVMRSEFVLPEFERELKKIRYSVEQALVQWANFGRVFAHTKHWFDEVHFTFPEPEYSSMYTKHFGCPIKYGQPYNEFLFAVGYLNAPLDFANKKIARMCEQLCDSVLNELSEKKGLIHDIQKLLARNPGRALRLPEVAENLFMSERTLRRRLADEGTSFQQVVQDFRLGLAKKYLSSSNLPIAEISDLIGYSEPANFHRAFCKKFDVTPNQFREHGDLVAARFG
jgi:AraC-like DNA-binding protein